LQFIVQEKGRKSDKRRATVIPIGSDRIALRFLAARKGQELGEGIRILGLEIRSSVQQPELAIGNLLYFIYYKIDLGRHFQL